MGTWEHGNQTRTSAVNTTVFSVLGLYGNGHLCGKQRPAATTQLPAAASKRSAAAMPPTYFEHAPRVFLICSERITNVLGGYINLDGARHEYTTLQKAIRDHVESEDKGVNELVTP